MVTTSLAAFLDARLREKEPPGICGCYDADHQPPCTPQPWADRKRREIKAMRSILGAYKAIALDFTHVNETEFEFARREALEQACESLAGIWDDHPDYRPAGDWSP
jgi:hypothetical protein